MLCEVEGFSSLWSFLNGQDIRRLKGWDVRMVGNKASFRGSTRETPGPGPGWRRPIPTGSCRSYPEARATYTFICVSAISECSRLHFSERGASGLLTSDYNVEESSNIWVRVRPPLPGQLPLMSAGFGSGFAGCHSFTAGRESNETQMVTESVQLITPHGLCISAGKRWDSGVM